MQIVQIGGASTKPQLAETVGSKAANLARMAALGLPVPPAFVLPVELCAAIVDGDSQAKRNLTDGLRAGIAFLEQTTGRHFGDRRQPLLVSVRSGAARSMPGMLDTVLDVGCTLAAVHGLVRMTGHPRFAWDCRRRFIESYSSVVLGVDRALLADNLSGLLATEGAASQQALDSEAIEQLARTYQQTIESEDLDIPDNPVEQLEAAAQAVYRSWMSDRARTYRRLEHLEGLAGTAVTIQAMVYGNRGLTSGAGVAFSRDPSTGAPQPVIDVLFDSQGEDVVSGNRTPETEEAIARSLPAAAAQLRETLARLERELGDVQDVEFTIENGKLWILQTRAAKRTPQAALRFAADFVKEGLITPSQALQRLDGIDLQAIAHRQLVDAGVPAARGTGASPGIAIGRAAFDSESAERLAASDPVILVRPDTSTADVAGFAVSAGIVTAIGGRTAHAALVARQMGKPCIVGCAVLSVDAARQRAQISGLTIRQGDWLSIDGEAGAIYIGRHKVTVE
ncbi:MAG: pyruvate, phosphate dikinase, partial [Pseudolabrys sp.]|nr:pyruvate, phosphate dikinase [Pseudolabrys sp.]